MRDSVIRSVRAIPLVLFCLAAVVPARAELIDRILAVVGQELITLSDVAAALRLGLVPPAPPGRDPVRVALDALVARQLELAEANRYQPPEPPAAEVDERLAAVRARFANAAALQEALAGTGLTEEQVRLRLRDDLRLEAYLQQRFGAARQPTDDEVADYYRAHAAEFATARGPQPLAEVRDRVRSRVAAVQRAALVEEWLEGLRRRAEVTDLYVGARGAPPSRDQ